MEFPKTRRENLTWRTNLLRRCQTDIPYRLKMKELFHRDILFAFNAFFYTYDPRKRPFHNIPFATWEFQDPEILALQAAIAEGRDHLIEKTRDMGVSWIVLLVFLHAWLDPIGGTEFLLGSRIEDYVDKKGDMRTLFQKERYALYKLPKWLRPEGFKEKKHDNYMRLYNPETGAVIAGESNNPNFSTGGRYAGILFDEFAKWESTDESAWTAAGDASPCRIAVSTPFGAGGQYYKLVTDGKTKRTTLHWKLHPEKSLGISCVWPPPNEDDKGRMGEHWEPEIKLTSPWYAKECLRRSPTEIAQELDIDYIGAGNPVFDGRALTSLRFYHKIPDEPIAWGKLKLEELEVELSKEAPIDDEGYLIVYEMLNPTHRYTVGWDVVEGVEDGDYAVGTVLDRMTKDIVAVYFSKIDEVMLSRVVKIVNEFYSTESESVDAPWCGIETNGPGLSTFDFTILLGVTNLFMAPRYDVIKGGVSYKKGWRTDTNSRNELISGIKNYLIGRAGKLNSQRLVGELLTFVRSKTGKAQAKSGTHDDMVMSFGIALQIDDLLPLEYEVIKKARPDYPGQEYINPRREELVIEEDNSIGARCLRTATKARDALEHPEVLEMRGGYYA